MQDIIQILGLISNPMYPDEFMKLIKSITSDEKGINLLVNKTKEFLGYFGSFLRNHEFQVRAFDILKISYDICESPEDIMDIFLKTSILNLIQIYLNYSKIEAKEAVLNILGSSFGKNMLPGPQILNVCLMVDPIFKGKEYLQDKNKTEETAVTYAEKAAVERNVKAEIDKWIKAQEIVVEKQDLLIANLKSQLKTIAESKGFNVNSDRYQDLELECVEMLSMQITSLALMAELDDEDLSPVPIN
jgi:hypothetical protein